MFLIKFLFWLVTLPIRLVLFALGLAFWIVTLPIRIVFGILGFIGFGRLLQLATVGAVGYFMYKLVNPDPEDLAPPPPSAADLNSVPST
jgi:hypothetical protein